MKPIASKIAFAAALAAGSYLPISAIATPITASMNLTADVHLGTAADSQNSNSSWGTLLDPLSVSANASIAPAGTNFSMSAFGQGNASWGAGGNSGSVQFTDYGWIVSTGGSGLATLADLNNHTGGDDWTYTFVADANGTFTMNYNVIGSGDTFGLWGWDISWTGPGGGDNITNPTDPTTSGVFFRPILAGQTYTIALDNNANISNDSGFGAVGSMDGTFEWSIQQSVPEPGSLALLGMGLAGLAASRRRKS